MTDTAALKRRVREAIDDNDEAIRSLAESVHAEPELGYKETETTRKVAEEFRGLGLDVETELAVTGARARAGGSGAEQDDEFVFALLGELDALVNPGHPAADPETGACHACGHEAQLANLVGAAYGLVASGVVDDLPGAVEFIAVPAEEYLDLEYRRGLLDDGKIEFFGGKQELIRRGYFDDVDCAAMIHAASETPEREVTSDFSSNGFVGKTVQYEGRESHAGGAPEEGVNALNAAMAGMNAVNANRETFPDEEHVRVHPIVTKGGDGVNVVPADVRMESYVRAKRVDAIEDANGTTNRALESGAMAVGANVTIEDFPGYLPLRTDGTLVAAFDDNAREVIGEDAVHGEHQHVTGSTDMGDVSQIVPAVHPWTGGFEGAAHSTEFGAVDEEMAYLLPAKVTGSTVVDVLADPEKREAIRDAKGGKRSTEAYLEIVRGMRNTLEGSYMDA
ncbi:MULTISPECIES: amidohydrolase [Halolamina]|uniref:Peptidase M20 domain-containing protein 2 n=1 Tax=Halolamina pelagica TaxID=699431 RepID=A0A1I5MH63_9EURY|nr:MULTISPECIES: amidohydrolase [Halolamina]NHX36023.1 amidohydrolase [Halolamina sp. R1-12]SFP08863.1 amidohydrolase [Halolamina pelagica]